MWAVFSFILCTIPLLFCRQLLSHLQIYFPHHHSVFVEYLSPLSFILSLCAHWDASFLDSIYDYTLLPICNLLYLFFLHLYYLNRLFFNIFHSLFLLLLKNLSEVYPVFFIFLPPHVQLVGDIHFYLCHLLRLRELSYSPLFAYFMEA